MYRDLVVNRVTSTTVPSALELLLLLEEHAKADDGAVDQEPTDDGHDHGLHRDDATVRQQRG